MSMYQSGEAISIAMDIYEMATAKGIIPDDGNGPYLTEFNFDMEVIMPGTKRIIDTTITFN